MTAGVRRVLRRGTSSAFAIQCAGIEPEKRFASRASTRRVLRSVLRPVHVDRHCNFGGKPVGGGALEEVSRSGKPAQADGTGTEVFTSGAFARLAARHRSRKGSSVARKKRKDVTAFVPARIVSSGFFARTQ